MTRSTTTRSPEISALMSCLDGQRRHVLRILDGLDDAAFDDRCCRPVGIAWAWWRTYPLTSSNSGSPRCSRGIRPLSRR